jgi:hypothetical protein
VLKIEAIINYPIKNNEKLVDLKKLVAEIDERNESFFKMKI